MKNLIFPLILMFVSCTQHPAQQKDKPIEKKELKTKAFETAGHKNKGILLSEKVKIYDNKQNVLREIEAIYGEVVTIDSISKLKFELTNSDDRCNLHHFVKVKGKGFSGWIYGDLLFEIEEGDRAVKLGSSGEIIPTKNFNIGVYDDEEDMLSFCSENQNPVLFHNTIFNKYEYLPILPKNENYPQGYLTFDNHDGWKDVIRSFSSDGRTLKIQIYREYQEGSATIDLEIELSEKQSTCKVVKVEKEEG